MKRNYKLACNYNQVEIEFDEKDLFELAEENEVNIEVGEDGDLMPIFMVDEIKLIKRLLQREYDILSSIVTNNMELRAVPEPVDPPSEKQAEFAASLGMKDPMKHTKKEVWEYIKKHRGY